jgi:hypothetical protein
VSPKTTFHGGASHRPDLTPEQLAHARSLRAAGLSDSQIAYRLRQLGWPVPASVRSPGQEVHGWRESDVTAKI